MKKILLGLGAAALAVAGVAAMSAYEAHIINVTAKIENALSAIPDQITFGTVFPQEAINKDIKITLSQSFLEEERVDDVEYVIKQKPKCVLNPQAVGADPLPEYGRVIEDGQGVFSCENPDSYTMMPLLCPFLSKHETTREDLENDSVGINAFHGPVSNWVLQDTVDTQVAGKLAKSANDTEDVWSIDFRVPCFVGQCAQDWADFVYENNPIADAAKYILPAELEHKQFGCDLWIETTGISRSNQIGIYKEEGDSTPNLGARIGTLSYTVNSPLSGTVIIDTVEGLAWINDNDEYLLVLQGPRTGTVADGGTNQLLALAGCADDSSTYGPSPVGEFGWDGWWSNRTTDNIGTTDTNCDGIEDGTSVTLSRMEGYYNFMFDVTGADLKDADGVSFSVPLLPNGSYNEVQFLIKKLVEGWPTVGEYPGAGEADGLTSYFDFKIQ